VAADELCAHAVKDCVFLLKQLAKCLRETLIYSPAAYMHMGEFGLYRA